MPYKHKEDYNAWQRRNHEKRKSWAKASLGGVCKNCGTKFGLEFDHIDPTKKKFDIGNSTRHGLEEIKKELEKCQLLCKPCHQIKTGVAVHGTRAKYVGGCRCYDCTKANREYYREYHKKD